MAGSINTLEKQAMESGDTILNYCGNPPSFYPENTNAADKFIFQAYIDDLVPKMVVKPLKGFNTTSEGILLRHGKCYRKAHLMKKIILFMLSFSKKKEQIVEVD